VIYFFLGGTLYIYIAYKNYQFCFCLWSSVGQNPLVSNCWPHNTTVGSVLGQPTRRTQSLWLRGWRPLYRRPGLRVAAWPQCPKSVCAGVGCGLDWTLASIDTAPMQYSSLTCGAMKVLTLPLPYLTLYPCCATLAHRLATLPRKLAPLSLRFGGGVRNCSEQLCGSDKTRKYFAVHTYSRCPVRRKWSSRL